MTVISFIIQPTKQERIDMKASKHAALRFLQRIMNFKDTTYKEIGKAMEFLEKDTSNIDFHGRQRFILPSFPQFVVIQRENVIITVIPKKH